MEFCSICNQRLLTTQEIITCGNSDCSLIFHSACISLRSSSIWLCPNCCDRKISTQQYPIPRSVRGSPYFRSDFIHHYTPTAADFHRTNTSGINAEIQAASSFKRTTDQNNNSLQTTVNADSSGYQYNTGITRNTSNWSSPRYQANNYYRPKFFYHNNTHHYRYRGGGANHRYPYNPYRYNAPYRANFSYQQRVRPRINTKLVNDRPKFLEDLTNSGGDSTADLPGSVGEQSTVELTANDEIQSIANLPARVGVQPTADYPARGGRQSSDSLPVSVDIQCTADFLARYYVQSTCDVSDNNKKKPIADLLPYNNIKQTPCCSYNSESAGQQTSTTKQSIANSPAEACQTTADLQASDTQLQDDTEINTMAFLLAKAGIHTLSELLARAGIQTTGDPPVNYGKRSTASQTLSITQAYGMEITGVCQTGKDIACQTNSKIAESNFNYEVCYEKSIIFLNEVKDLIDHLDSYGNNVDEIFLKVVAFIKDLLGHAVEG